MTAGRNKREFHELCRVEPRLRKLEEDILQHRKEALKTKRAGKPYCANRPWYAVPRGFKERLCQLVGWDRDGHPVLGTCEAYALAYHYLYNLLPDCSEGCNG